MVVLEINRREWIQNFQQASPLKRDLLANIIGSLFPDDQYHRRPRDLVIDLDLSPSIALMASHGAEVVKADMDACQPGRPDVEQTFYHNLKAQQCLNSVLSKYGKSIVLPQPGGLDEMTKYQVKLMQEWQTLLAKSGVFFSSAKLEFADDTLVTYNARQANLAKVTALKRDVVLNDTGGILNFTGFLSAGYVSPVRFDNNYHLEFDGSFPDFSTKTVFLGINNGVADLHNSPFGKVSGVLGHAVNYYSYISPFRLNKYKVLVFLAEVFLGFWVAKLLGEIWNKRIGVVGTHYFARMKRLMLALLLCVLPVLIGLVLNWIIQWLFHAFIWASPSLFMFSIWIKATLERSYAFRRLFRSNPSIQVTK